MISDVLLPALVDAIIVVIWFRNGQGGEEALCNHFYSVALLDVQLSEKSGLYRGQRKLAVIFLGAVVFISGSRVAIGTHFTYVIGGAVVGVLATFIVSKLLADNHKQMQFT